MKRRGEGRKIQQRRMSEVTQAVGCGPALASVKLPHPPVGSPYPYYWPKRALHLMTRPQEGCIMAYPLNHAYSLILEAAAR